MTAPRIFVSHSHQNNDFGLRLVGDLRQRLGEDGVWYDVSGGLHGGDEWWDMILRELTSRDTFIVILSPDAMASKWVRDEMSIAWRLRHEVGLTIIPVLWQPCERRADFALLQEVSFMAPRAYDAGLAELFGLLGVSTNQQPAPVAPPIDRRTEVLQRLAGEIHTAFGRQDWAVTIRKSDLLLAEAPEAMTPMLWRERAFALLSLGQNIPALDAVETALRLDPFDVPTLRTKVRVLVMANRLAEAQTTIDRAFALAPLDDRATHLDLLIELFDVQHLSGAYEQAVATATEALRLAPKEEAWQQRRAMMEKAIVDVERARQQQAEAERRAREEEARRQEAVRLAELQRQEQARQDKLLPARLHSLGFALLLGKAVIVPPTVAVPAATFAMGGDKDSFYGTSRATVQIAAFRISTYPVTVAEYACAVAEKAVPEPRNWASQQQKPDHPVVNVSWLNVVAYALWLSQQTGQTWRLPTEAEWEYAARGTDGRFYPWGSQWDKNRANTSDGGPKTTTPVGTYADKGDASPFGAHDQSGNVWEWTSSLWREDKPYDASVEKDADTTSPRVLRGGSWNNDSRYARVASRFRNAPASLYDILGARLVLVAGLVQ
ncbi:MAG: SUMF1/EgtB/PvdO family nonheme iron enzyme [Ktedonobacterales bacterium]|nr:SUMF1/EgtB/PvdO family nonheme iron enzyme [Ktedonobacterales bacterium]